MSALPAANLPNKPPRWVERRPAASKWLKPRSRRQGCNPDPLMSALGHVWTYMDPARLQQGDWVRCNSHKC